MTDDNFVFGQETDCAIKSTIKYAGIIRIGGCLFLALRLVTKAWNEVFVMDLTQANCMRLFDAFKTNSLEQLRNKNALSYWSVSDGQMLLTGFKPYRRSRKKGKKT